MMGYPRVTGSSCLREGSKGVCVCMCVCMWCGIVCVCLCMFVCVCVLLVSKTPPKRLCRLSSNLVGKVPWGEPLYLADFRNQRSKVRGQRSN